MIGFKKAYFPLIRLPSCYRTVCYWIVCYQTVQKANHIQRCSLKQPITFKVVITCACACFCNFAFLFCFYILMRTFPFFHSYDYRPNWTPLSPITITYFLLRLVFQLYLGTQFYFVRVLYLLIYLTCVFSSLNNVLLLLCVIFLTHIYVLSGTVLTLWVAPSEMFCSWYRI